eukprot:58671-Pleurochrysis_carterae.AAC.7
MATESVISSLPSSSMSSASSDSGSALPSSATTVSDAVRSRQKVLLVDVACPSFDAAGLPLL